MFELRNPWALALLPPILLWGWLLIKGIGQGAVMREQIDMARRREMWARLNATLVVVNVSTAEAARGFAKAADAADRFLGLPVVTSDAVPDGHVLLVDTNALLFPDYEFGGGDDPVA